MVNDNDTNYFIALNEIKLLIQGNALDGIALIHGNIEDIKTAFPFYLSVVVKINRSIPLRNNSAIFKNLNNSFTLISKNDLDYSLMDLTKPITFPYRHKDLSL